MDQSQLPTEEVDVEIACLYPLHERTLLIIALAALGLMGLIVLACLARYCTKTCTSDKILNTARLTQVISQGIRRTNSNIIGVTLPLPVPDKVIKPAVGTTKQ